MTAVFVDTAAWFAVFVRSDARHAAAIRVWDSLRRGGTRLVTSSYVLSETLTLLKARLGVPGVERGSLLLQGGMQRLEVTPAVWSAAWALFSRHSDQRCSFVDCTTVVLMRGSAVSELFTFDDDFRASGDLRVLP